LVIALLGVSIALLIAIRLGLSGLALQVLSGRIEIFLIIALAQGGIGYIQYFTKLPEALVAAHIIGSIAVWLSAWNLFISSSLGANLIARKGL
jgi:cytochrome c oxidase assembly protein subunit 15